MTDVDLSKRWRRIRVARECGRTPNEAAEDAALHMKSAQVHALEKRRGDNETTMSKLLRNQWMFYVAATAMTYMFWWSGITKILDFQGTLAGHR